ncbi:hypothetical protein HF650_02010 [Kosakonia sp. SMBL-WEM22]|uniref:DUF7716 domain-containing protein n=1 Tax=Kosakonia sp. SMBL-WEM22 TaxID=2725560 RepID=UPI001659C02B|nr:hypothetical protein [Kosakonia sp. SMBL-WEM22]MDV5354852.1 hypothetical protein [Enterobacter asburiae]QNQ18618.1 hypothetical protein HF650_02010 [Kosakonia sp. SMBL-WEM22]
MPLISIRELLLNPQKNPEGWLFLPPDSEKWSLETQGVFSSDSSDDEPGADNHLPAQVKQERWIESLDNSTIEDIVCNAQEQLGTPGEDRLFQAFKFYFDNDAFIQF